ncbi:MAG: hypothetical protein AAGG48_23165 [Planctomycetota bacterium]
MARLVCCTCLVWLTFLCGSVEAQRHHRNRNRGIRGNVFLPVNPGATVLGSHLHGQAVRAVAMGRFLESAAVARRINLESDRIAMENSILWVETYFERRRLNREYRDEERIDYQEHKLIVGRYNHKRVEESDPGGNPADGMNYMMGRLIADSSAYRTIFLGQVPDIDGADFFLSPSHLSHIVLKQVGGSEGARTLRPTDPELVSDQWPGVFMRPEFELERIEYDDVRKKALEEIRENNQLSVVTLEAVQSSLKNLQNKFDTIYTWPRMKGTIDIATYAHYRDVGENFFRAQAAGTLRAFAMNNPDSYSDDLRFEGETILDLLRHCSQHNLEFAKPEPGDEPTYAHLYQQMRQLYLDFIPNPPDY